MERMSAARKRDVSVELLRIIGACMVIGTHIKLNMAVENEYVLSRVWIGCLVGDGVAIFWLILGCFYFGNTDAGKRYGRLFSRIVIPMLAFTAFMFFFHDFIVGKATLAESVRHTPEEYRRVVEQAVWHWFSETPGTGHFWYLWIYILAILIFPMLKGARDALVGDGTRDLKLLIAMFGLLIYNDLTGNDFFNFTHHTFGGLLGAIIWILTGDIVYRNRALVKGRVGLGMAGLAVAAGVNALRAFVQYRCFLADPANSEPLYWYASFAYAHTLGLTAFVFGVSGIVENGPVSRVVAHVGQKTFGVYIWHVVVLEKLRTLGVRKWLTRRLCVSAPGDLLFTALYTLLIFLISLAITEATSLVWRRIWRGRKGKAAAGGA